MWTMDLNIRDKTLRSMQGEKTQGVRFGDDVLDLTPKAQVRKEK